MNNNSTQSCASAFCTLHPASAAPSLPQEHGCEGHSGCPWRAGQGLLLPAAARNSSDFCLNNSMLLWEPGILKDTKPSPSLNINNTFKQLLLFFDKLYLSKMTGHLRENDTNLCKSQQYNCNIHFHLRSIFKVVMETDMDWMGNIWQGNPMREAEEMWELQGDLLTSAAKVKVHTVTSQAHSCAQALQKTRTVFPIQTQPTEREMQQNIADVAQHGKHPKTSLQRDAWLGKSLVAVAVENLRQEMLQCFNHDCIPLSSQSLSDTEIHPGNLDKTSCHRAGWQL